ncbi:thiopeptide-type bacteriocin biosynthesis protein [Plantactinospora sp. CA-290183]|uniref:thiopeptide-type bacteriocin biosynthesis protein n=1 Tax=Plantactinospora sp. CA-290183 TaxID=3240006 RepID=UPI003D8CCF1F
MPAHHLTATPPHQLAAAVLQLLAGANLEATADGNDLDPLDLIEARQVYQAAGLAALQRRAEHEWYQVLVQFGDWPGAETSPLGPHLDQLTADGAIAGGWWYLRKYPCWRLRFRDADTTAVNKALDDLSTTGVLARWWPTIYESETDAFGGPVAMHIVHDLFIADSHGALAYARHPNPPLDRRHLSLLLINALLDAAGLDWFERGDVYARVRDLRPAPAGADTPNTATLADTIRPLLARTLRADDAARAYGEPAASIAAWLAAFDHAGQHLRRAATDGTLGRGLRTVLGQVLIFHWNRLGLSARTQGILATAATTAILPRS